ncbi:MAG: FAD-binding oxidoreductase [Rhodobacteraceae bacterium]|nr:FAD-binding oxidoreductase [Paracoccaceae bacterium]
MSRVSVLPKNDRNCAWAETLATKESFATLRDTVDADVCVIGAGYAGLACARRLGELMPERRIVLIEAEEIGNGPAGRSSGFAIDLAYDVRAGTGEDARAEFKAQTALNRSGLGYLEQTVQGRGIACDWDPSGKIHGAATPEGEAALDDFAAALDAAQEPYQRLDRDQMAARLGTSYYRSGILAPGAVLLQPAALVQGLAATMPDNVTVFENTPCVGLTKGAPHLVQTPQGLVRAKEVALTVNSHARYFGFYAKHLIPFATYGSMTRVLNRDELALLGDVAPWGLVPAHPFGSSLRLTNDNRLLVRHSYGYAARSAINPATTARLAKAHRASFEARFPKLGDVPFEYSWGGALCLSRNGMPVFGDLEPGIFGAFCMNGVGITRGTIMGKLLAEKIAGRDSDLLRVMMGYGRPNRLPPQLITRAGVTYEMHRRTRAAGRER